MNDFNPIMFIWEFFQKMIDMGKVLYDFIFMEMEVLGFTVSVWQILGGVGLTGVLIFVVVKALNPL